MESRQGTENKYYIEKKYDVIIIGGGTSGLFCAYEASKKGLKIALIEHNEKLGVKLAIAGGGMGNMTNRTINTDYYIGHDVKELKKLLSSLFKNFSCEDVLNLLHLFNIPFEERDFGQIFCLKPVKKIIECLEKACVNVDFFLGERPQRIYYDELDTQSTPQRHVLDIQNENDKELTSCKSDEREKYCNNNEKKHYHIFLNNSHIFSTNLVIATGSTAYPQIGASDFGLRLAKKWGHDVYDFSPVLVPFIMNTVNSHPNARPHTSKASAASTSSTTSTISTSSTSSHASTAKRENGWNLMGLEGISIPVRMSISCGQTQYEDPCGIRSMLFTHKGLSGPAALVASCFWKEGGRINIDFLPDYSLQEAMHNPDNGKKNVKNLLLPLLPDRLVYRLIPEDLQKRKVAEIGKKDRQALIDLVHSHVCLPQKTEGLKKAEAARGGVSIKNLRNTLESNIHKGLYFCGEVVDITGLLGGYNIHFALASAKRVAHSLQI